MISFGTYGNTVSASGKDITLFGLRSIYYGV